MNILSLLHDTIHYLRIDTPLMGQKKIIHSEVVIPSSEAEKFNIDVWALHLKKALTDAQVTKYSTQKVALVLGQRFFQFVRVEIPTDIQDSAIGQYVKSKIQETLPQNPENSLLKYYLMENRGKKFAQVYIINPEVMNQIRTLLSFYELSAAEIYPESLLIFDLFAHTLNKTKEEPSLFLEYDNQMSYGLLFDATGLYSPATVFFPSKDVNSEVKKVNAQEKNTLARLILSGTESASVRQDSFTKDVGVWTNPLHKILPTSSLVETAKAYEFENVFLEYSRELVLLKRMEDKSSKLLSMSPNQQTGVVRPTVPTTRIKSSGGSVKKFIKPIAFVLVSFVATFFVLRTVMSSNMALPKLPLLSFMQPTATPTPTPIPEPTPTPTPAADKEDLVIEIQNGVGTPGLAGKFKAFLEKKDYTVESVGNADNYDYEKTTVITSDQGVYGMIVGDLSEIGGKKAVFEKTNDKKKTIIIIGADLQIP